MPEFTIEDLQKGMATALTDAVTPLMAALESKLEEATKPGIRKALIDEHGDEKTDLAIRGGKFFQAIYDHSILGKAITDDIETATIDSDHVAYGTPTEISSEINRIESQISLARMECRYFPQGALTVNKLLLSTGLSMTHPTEAASGGFTKSTYTQRIFTKIKGMMNVPLSNDLFSPGVSAVNMFDEIVRLMAEESAADIDTYAFNDNTSPHIGILNAAGNSVYLGDPDDVATGFMNNVPDDILYNKLIDMTTAVDPSVLGNAKFVFSQTNLGRIRKIKTSTAEPIPVFTRRLPGDPVHYAGYILDYPAIVSTRMPSFTTCSAADIAVGFFGNMQKYEIGQIDDLVIDMSKEASLAVTDGTISAWENDLTFLRGRIFRSANLAVPAAFVKLETSITS